MIQSAIRLSSAAVLAALLVLSSCSPRDADAPPFELEPAIGERLAEFAPTILTAETGALDDSQLAVLELLIAASRPLDEVFLRQANRDNERYRGLLSAQPGEQASAARAYFDLQKGIYERQHDWRPFVAEVAPRPLGGGFYPADMTREEFAAYVEEHPEQREELSSLTTLVHRDGDRLVAEPYSHAFSPWLEEVAANLERAAELTENESLRAYLTALVEALATDRYFEADMAWMDLDSRVELTLGPYETYEDELFGSKASFESFVTVIDPAEGARLGHLKQLLPDFERGLPIDDAHKNFSRGTESPIRVADLVFSAGDARAGIQTIAFNLPNDEAVRERKGSKKVLLRNVMAAKFDAILEPIAREVLYAEQASLVSRDAFLDEVLHHELSHGLGPGRITVGGETREVREFLQENYSPIEEAKADAVGVWNLLTLLDDGAVESFDRDQLAATYLAGLFRAARFGTASAHGKGACIQFNVLRGEGAISIDAGDGRVRIEPDRFRDGVRVLANRLLTIQALGDHTAAARLVEQHGETSAEMKALIERLSSLPVDIRPVYTLAGEGL